MRSLRFVSRYTTTEIDFLIPRFPRFRLFSALEPRPRTTLEIEQSAGASIEYLHSPVMVDKYGREDRRRGLISRVYKHAVARVAHTPIVFASGRAESLGGPYSPASFRLIWEGGLCATLVKRHFRKPLKNAQS